MYGSVAKENDVLISLPSLFSQPKLKKRSRVTAQYDPTDWKETTSAVFTHTYLSPAFFVVSIVGTVLVLLSPLPRFSVAPESRSCRSWCTNLAIGPQAHQYVGIVLFLIMAFRNNSATNALNSGLKIFFTFKAAIRSFANILLNRVQHDVSPMVRARALALAIAFPYAVVLDIRENPHFPPGTVDGVLSASDVAQIVDAPTPPLAVLELLTAHITTEIVPQAGLVGNQLLGALGGVVAAYGECERIKDFPIILSYIAHLRVLLVAYLITLPLALVESMGFATIIVHWVVSYALMSLEELAVDCENPFDGQGKSDLRLLEQCDLIKEQSLESWQRWIESGGNPCSNWQEEPYTEVAVGE